MRTPGMSDEELDALFRRGAEAYPDEVHLGAWARMEDKLNEDTVNRLLRRKIARFFALELVVVGLALLVWQLAGRHATPALSNRVKTTSSVVAPDANATKQTAASRHQPSVTLGSSPTSRPDVSSPHTISVPGPSKPSLPQTSSSLAKPHTTTKPTVSTQQASNARLVEASNHKLGWLLPIKQRRSSTTVGESPVSAAELDPAAIQNAAISIATSDATTGNTTTEATAPTTTAATPESASPKVVLAELPAVPPTASAPDSTTQQTATPTATDSTDKHARVQPAYRLLIGALGAPSLSAVRSVQTARMGGDLGLSVEYRLTNRLRLRASVIRSVKRYKVESQYYTPPTSWNWYPGDYEVNGNCRITEIPLDLRYDLISRARNTVFFSAGINSLLMRNERYSYDYYNSSGQLRTAAVKVENGANFVLSVVNLSAGAERQLSNHLSVQAEPFVQLPLGGVGAARVRLSSAGLLFSLKYGLLPSRRALLP